MNTITFNKRQSLDTKTIESYKALRTNIQFCGNQIQVISFTSCTPNEGKSSITFNLAESFAECGKKVLMIDADMRKSVLVGRYQVGAVERGLSDFLSGQCPFEEVCLKTDIEGMDIIFSGPFAPNPTELLQGQIFDEMLKHAREVYDYVLIDTPPLGSVTDSAIVAKVVDGAILVIEADAISYRFAQNVKNQLERSNVRILGTVLNKVPFHSKKYAYGAYGHYGSYGSYGMKSEEKNTRKSIFGWLKK